jgi:hypothetical protein
MIIETGNTYVRRLSVVSRERDALALRLRLERTLGGADFHPPGLPRAAILCVRRLSDRRGRAALAPSRGALGLADWRRAVAAAIERLARHAASPARGSVPANAEAVIFLDQAELLACLAADWCEAAAPARWWWRDLFAGRDITAALLSAWLAAPEHVPAALGRLSASGKLITFARALGEPEAISIRRGVVRKFGLHELSESLDSSAGLEERAARRAPRSADEEARDEPTAANGRTGPTVAPWERYVPEVRGYRLGLEQSCLAGVGLMLLRAPSRVRSSSFAETVTRWRVGRDAAAVDEPAPAPTAPAMKVPERPAPEVERVPPVFKVERAEQGRAPDVSTDARGEVEARSLTPLPHASAPRADAGQVAEANVSPSHPEEFDGEPPRLTDALDGDAPAPFERDEARSVLRPTRPGDDVPGAGSTRDEYSTAAVPDEASEFVLPAVVSQARIKTEFGGLFYLVNLGLFLNLYGDFTTPLKRGLDLDLWDFLALLGRRLCGERVREDAVWALLAGLAGRREDETPGRDFAPADEWRLPPEWLAPYPEHGIWEWSDGGGRLRVLHPEGFLVFDVPLAPEPLGRRPTRGSERQLADELNAYDGRVGFTLRRAHAAGGDEDEKEVGALEEWLGRLAPYVGARLRRALGAGEAGEAARLLCEQVAEVSVTETRLDVTFELARLPVEVRLSGLDRDPGWVPAAGRHVAFHFE